MANHKYKLCPGIVKLQKNVEEEFLNFWDTIETVEKKLNIKPVIFQDGKSKAFYIECHIPASVNHSLLDINAELDPEEQSEYRANRELQPQHKAFKKMLSDAKAGRQFSDIIIEYNKSYSEDLPLKVLGGQHRSVAIQEAESESNRPHGFKVYFSLSSEQRNEIAQISNTNISLPTDLLDRMQETLLKTGLRDWCQKVGLLGRKQDFADRKNHEGIITVRVARSFVINFYNGKDVEYDPNILYVPYICKSSTGNFLDLQYKKLIDLKGDKTWNDKDLINSGKNFNQMHRTQMKEIEKNSTLKKIKEYKTKAITPVVVASWALLAGLLVGNKEKQEKLFSLKNISKRNPLSAELLSSAKHHSDPDTYRGIGNRIDTKELGRMIEVLMQFVENNKNFITKEIIDFALKNYHVKKAQEDVDKAKKKI